MGVRSAARGVPVRGVLVTGVIAVVAVVAVVGACGTPEETSSSASAAPSTSTTSPASGHDPDDEPPEGPAGFTPVPIAEVGLAVPADCPVPWLPVYAQDEQTYPVSVPTTEVRPSGGTPIPDLTTLRLQAPDSDGDGVADVALEGVDDGAAFALGRGDGELVLAVAGGSVGAPGGGSRAGDLDGDGRDELLVFVADGSGESDHPLYVVPGAVPAGRHDPRAVGARLPAFAGMPAAPLGDVDGDGNQDLLLPRSSDELMVVSGTIIMDALGGAVRDDVAPLVVLPADVRSALLLVCGRSSPGRAGPHPERRTAGSCLTRSRVDAVAGVGRTLPQVGVRAAVGCGLAIGVMGVAGRVRHHGGHLASAPRRPPRRRTGSATGDGAARSARVHACADRRHGPVGATGLPHAVAARVRPGREELPGVDHADRGPPERMARRSPACRAAVPVARHRRRRRGRCAASRASTSGGAFALARGDGELILAVAWGHGRRAERGIVGRRPGR